MKKLLFFVLSLSFSVTCFGYYLPSQSYLQIESGFGFSTFSSLNQGITASAANLENDFGAQAAGKEFKPLNFEVPILVKLGLRPFTGSAAHNMLLSIRSGVLLTHSWNSGIFSDSVINFNYAVAIVPIEIGLEYQLFSFGFIGGTLSVSGGIAAGAYFGFFRQGYSESPAVTGTDLSQFPKVYSGIGFGGSVSLNTVWQISSSIGISGSVFYRYANIGSLKDGNNQLYINQTGFTAAASQPANSEAAGINLSGVGFSFGINFAFGEKRITNIPEGVYR